MPITTEEYNRMSPEQRVAYDKTIGEQPSLNTDRELWRETPGDFYANSIHVTQGGMIGINVGGSVHVRSVTEWHMLAEKDRPIPKLKLSSEERHNE